MVMHYTVNVADTGSSPVASVIVYVVVCGNTQR